MGLSLKKKQLRWAERLEKLANYLQFEVQPAVDAGKVNWNMKEWAVGAKPRPELSCGTAACAAGYGTNIFGASGLILVEMDRYWSERKSEYVSRFEVYDRNNHQHGLGACDSFFGTDLPFTPDSYDKFDTWNGIVDVSGATMPRVINYLRQCAYHFRNDMEIADYEE